MCGNALLPLVLIPMGAPVIFVYFSPSLIALISHRNRSDTILINLFLGWTVIGWLVALRRAGSLDQRLR